MRFHDVRRRDGVERPEPERGVQQAGATLRLRRLRVRHGLQVLIDEGCGAVHGARYVAPEDGEAEDVAGRHAVARHASEDLERRQRTKQDAPRVIVVRHRPAVRAGRLAREPGEQQAHDAVGALEEGADLHEVVALVAQHRAEHHASREVRPVLHPVDELRHVARGEAGRRVGAGLEPRRVEGLPHLRGDRAANGASIFARGAQAVEDARRVAAVEGEEVDHAMRLDRVVPLGIGALDAERGQHPLPSGPVGPGLVGQQRQAVLHVERAGEVLRALGIAAEPVDVVCGAAQHGSVLQHPGVLGAAALR